MFETDYLVVGSGVAGMTYAIKIAEKFPDRKITVLTKTKKEESNTRYAQGGVAIVQDFEVDSFQKHIADTIIAGAGLCDEDVVKQVVEKGPQMLQELVSWGADFDKDSKGNIALCKEGGHSAHRIVHYKDITGAEISRTLIDKASKIKNIEILPQFFVIDLISDANACFGVSAYNTETKSSTLFKSSFTVLATGGVGSVYGATTNPSIATGDGIAMAHRVGAKIKNMHYIQFHPTALYLEEDNTYFLITEAIRGAGALLKNNLGDRFMLSVDSRAELAPRDIVARAIYNELQKKDVSQVYLDCSAIDNEILLKNFPNIYKQCADIGLDLFSEWIPIQPVSHYVCGGIVVDKTGATNIENLYACGECAHTGLHGANRLASNSLLEALVYADAIYEAHCTTESISPGNMLFDTAKNLDICTQELAEYKIVLNEIMMSYVAIIRSNKGLITAQTKLHLLLERLLKLNTISIEFYEIKNMIEIAMLIVFDSINERENKGGYFNIDYKRKDPLYK